MNTIREYRYIPIINSNLPNNTNIRNNLEVFSILSTSSSNTIHTTSIKVFITSN